MILTDLQPRQPMAPAAHFPQQPQGGGYHRGGHLGTHNNSSSSPARGGTSPARFPQGSPGRAPQGSPHPAQRAPMFGSHGMILTEYWICTSCVIISCLVKFSET